MADSPDDDCGWYNSSLANMVNHDASSKIVTGNAASPTDFRDAASFKFTLVLDSVRPISKFIQLFWI